MTKIVELWRYPVKSMLGESVEVLPIDRRGAVGDRLFAVRDEAGKFGSGKNTRRFRRIDGLFRFQASSGPLITFPGGTLYETEIDGALSAELGMRVTLIREAEVPHFDAGPIHLITTSSLRVLGLSAVDARRFRPNLVVETVGVGFLEDGWLGRELQVGGEVHLRVTTRTERCAMVGFAQAELPEEPKILRELVRRNEARIGVYAEVLQTGAVRVGDDVEVR
jgi:uncharacterized protein